MAKDFGDKTTRTLDPTGRQFDTIVNLKGVPVLDSERNLAQQARQEALAETIRKTVPSGFIGTGINPEKDYYCHPRFSNLFYFGYQGGWTLNDDGTQTNGDSPPNLESPLVANVNGWIIPVTGTGTGSLPLAPNDIDTRNKIRLGPPPTNLGSVRADFIFLEVWLAPISCNPSTDNKPSDSEIWKYGNVEGGYTPLTDDILDLSVGAETSKRTQVQSRLRLVEGVDLTSFPDGFDTAKVNGRGAASADSTYTFTNMNRILGDPGLWRAGEGVASNTLSTVDGYTYAIPVCVVFRRNLAAYNDNGNVMGGFNRNTGAASRDDAKVFTLVQYNGYADSLDRPDLLASDQVASTDVFDLRHTVSMTGFDYQSLLKKTLGQLLGGNLRSTWKRSYSGCFGTAHTVVDTITDPGGASTPVGVFQLDGFDGKRRLFSDAAVSEWFQALAWVAPPISGPWPVLDAQDTSFNRSAGVDVVAQSKLSEFRASLSVSDSYAPTCGDASLPVPAGGAEGFVTYYADILRLTIADFNTKFYGYLRGMRFLNPTDRYDFKPNAVTIQKDGDDDSYESDNYFWCTGPILLPSEIPSGSGISGSHTGLERSNPAAYYGEIVAGSTQFIFPMVHGTIDETYVGKSVTIGNPDNPDDNGVYEILSVDNDLPGEVTLNRYDGWDTSSTEVVWDIAHTRMDTDSDLLIRLGPNFPNVAAEFLRVTASLQQSPGWGLSHLPKAIHEIELINPSANIFVSEENKLPIRWIRSAPVGAARYSSLLNYRVSPAYVDLGSKSVMIQPWTNMDLPNVAVVADSGLMPLVGADPWELFEGKTGYTLYGDIDQRFAKLFIAETDGGYTTVGFDIPMVPATEAIAGWNSGLNFFIPLAENSGASDWVSTESNGNTWMTFATHKSTDPSEGGGLLTFGVAYKGYTYNSMGMRHTSFDVDGGKSTVAGLELPWYMGPGRVFAVYERSDYEANSTDFDLTTRVATATGTGASNLLLTEEGFETDTLWFRMDDSGDGTFVIPSKLISGYDPLNAYILEANVFGFDRGLFQDNCRVIPVKGVFTAPGYEGSPAFLVPYAPNETEEARIRYTRIPYQGDVNGTQMFHYDTPHVFGQVTTEHRYNLANNPIEIDSATLLNNPTHFEILAATGFMTSIGTGTVTGASEGEIQFIEEGYELLPDPMDIQISDPLPRTGTKAWRNKVDPAIQSGENYNIVGNQPKLVSPQSAGMTDGLPLGGFFRDYHFNGISLPGVTPDVFYDVDGPRLIANFRPSEVVTGVSTGLINYFSSMADHASPNTEYLSEAVAGQGSIPFVDSPGVGDFITLVDANSSVPAPASGAQFRTTRGKAILASSGEMPGGPVQFTLNPSMLSNSKKLILSFEDRDSIPEEDQASYNFNRIIFPFVCGVALLVRSQPEFVGGSEVHYGDELQMVVVTAIPIAALIPDMNQNPAVNTCVISGVSGSNEGLSAAERYRVPGHPIVKLSGNRVPDLSAINLMRAGNLLLGLVPDFD